MQLPFFNRYRFLVGMNICFIAYFKLLNAAAFAPLTSDALLKHFSFQSLTSDILCIYLALLV